MEWTDKHKKLIYNAVKHYQINVISYKSADFALSEEILKNIFSDIKSTYIEPGFEVTYD